MAIILSFLLALSVQSPTTLSDELDRQIVSYFQNIENDEYEAQSLWSLVQVYRRNQAYRDRFFETGDSLGVTWNRILGRQNSAPSDYLELALHFDDEYLHLYLQLQVFPEEKRTPFFEAFYSAAGSEHLKELSRRVAASETIRSGDVQPERWDFSIFLILFYKDRIDVQEPQFYEEISQNLQKLEDQASGMDPVEQDYFYASLFQSLYIPRNLEAILPYYEQLVELPSLPNAMLKFNLYWTLDFSLYRTGHIDRSLEIQRRHTLPLAGLMGEQTTLNVIRATHGAYLYTIGKYEEAQQAFATALADSANLTPANKTRLLYNLSLVYYTMGENDRYIETQMEALDYAVDLNDFSHQLNINRNLHIFYRKNRNRELALRYIEEARNIAENAGSENELASIIISKSVYYRDVLGDMKRAASLLAEARELLEETSDYRLYVRTFYEQAGLYKEQGKYEASREIYKQVAAIGSENNNNRMYLQALVDLADVELTLGEYESSRKQMREFNVHDVTVVDFFVLVNARRIEAEIAYRQGRFSDAEKLITRTYEQVLERARNTTSIESGYWHIEPVYLNLFELYSELLAGQNRMGDLVNVLDQLKTINDASLIENPLVNAGLLTEEELSVNRRISGELDELRKKYLVASGSEQLSLQNEISVLTARKNRLAQQRSASGLFDQMNIWTIQSRLKSGEMILHATHILDRFYLLLIDNREISYRQLPFEEQHQKMFKNTIDGLRRGNTNLMDLHEIYSYLELDTLPADINSLIVIPDSYLYQLPLDVLPVSAPQSPVSYGAAEYLIERMDVRYLNNLQDFLRKEPGKLYALDFAGIGISDFSQTGDGQLMSLPQAPDEITSIISRLDRVGETRAYLETEGTPAAFRDIASSSQILHLASHSKISESDPLFSKIYLHPDNGTSGENSSGELYAYQLFDMNLNNELIMLNSCESGAGEFFPGAGIMGISRALRYAGANSLILNSWKVNDHFASEFAIEFYTHMNRGETKSNSLREAKIHFLKNNNANPHFWGSYMLNGDPRPVTDKPGNRPVLALLMVLFSAAVFYTHKQSTRS